MPSATASGADPTPNGTAKSRDHNQGNQDRKYTIEQKTAVIRVRKCGATAFYDILGLEESKTTATDGEIKKAYRKLSLLTHPDKNSYDGADEAFKMVSRAFQILSDPEKKAKFDKFGGDPDNRFGSGAASSASPFSGFARSTSSRQNPMWEEEISPEEMFNRFFGGGGAFGSPFGGGGGLFDSGPQFVFNLNGGPGMRVHQFGGGRPRRRPTATSHTTATSADGSTTTTPASLSSALSQLLPLLLLFLLPLLSSLFSAATAPAPLPSLRFERPSPPYTLHRQTANSKVSYFVAPADVADWTERKLHQLDQRAEVSFISKLRTECTWEMDRRDTLLREAQGFFWHDEAKMQEARSLELRSCKRLDQLQYRRREY
ncbi:MAG: hypothetical protein M1825_006313 [Sarcosagium campestre]|nr:MAG: hypothetical protein M1825_006313 [Sarcosagium campestre]